MNILAISKHKNQLSRHIWSTGGLDNADDDKIKSGRYTSVDGGEDLRGDFDEEAVLDVLSGL